MKSKRSIQIRNDSLRASIPLISPPDLLVVTRGVWRLGPEAVWKILEMVRDFNDFNEENDPWGEHDFGSFEYKGKKIFWKIDDYKGYDGYNLVLTVMLAEEY